MWTRLLNRYFVAGAGEDGSSEPRFSDGEALEVRLDAAQGVLADEREREQSLNTRAVAVGAAAAIMMGLLQRPIVAAFQLALPTWEHVVLTVFSGFSILAAVGVVLLAVRRVLRPAERDGLDEQMMAGWLEDKGMADAEQTARFELLDGTVMAVRSRRGVNAEKAEALDKAYWCLVGEVLAASPVLVTLALQ